MQKIVLRLLKSLAIAICLFLIVENYFLEIKSSATVPIVITISLILVLNKLTKKTFSFQPLRPSFIPFLLIPFFFTVLLRASFYWAINTFPVKDTNTVLLTLQEPFDDFAYSMVKQYLSTTIPQALVISIVLTAFAFLFLNSTKKRFAFVSIYFAATIALFMYEVPILNYIHILTDKPEKSTGYSKFFADNYINPDSIKITPPPSGQKRNLILIYLESLETTFADREHGGNQDINLIPEITEIAQQNINFGKEKKRIGGGLDAIGSNFTSGATRTRSLGIPAITNTTKAPILHHYKSIYKILNEYGYKQIFFQGNPGLYKEFRDFALKQKINEVYGPSDLIQHLNLDTADLIRKQGFKTVQDKEAFKFANQVLDTISEPFSLTFFTIDTHSPDGFYDPDCIKITDESNKDERLKAAARCVSRELKKFLDSLKTKHFYENTSIVIFGDHLFMGTRLVKDFNDRKWVNIFINPAKVPIAEEKRLFSDIDMFPTILSSLNFTIEGNRLGLGTDLFSDKKTLVERIGLDSLNKEIKKLPSHLIYESYLLKKSINIFQ